MTRKREKLFGWREDDICPLDGCGCADGISHALGGCTHPVLRRMYQERHNAGGRKVLAAVGRGAKGAALVQTDVGCEGKLEAEGLPDTLLPVTARHVPAHLLPAGQTARSRPDGLMVWTDDNKERHVRVLEIKVTSDTDPARALCTAEHQHADLLTLLRKPSDG